MPRSLLLAVPFLCFAAPVSARDCPAPPRDLPPGVRLAEPAGCRKALPPARAEAKRDGVIRLQNGTEIRVNGRVSVEGRTVR